MVATEPRPAEVDELFETLAGYLPEERVTEVRAAYAFAEECHRGQERLSGEPYITHPVAVAQLVAELRMDSATVKGALLHDVVEDCDVSTDRLRTRFGTDVARLVEGATKIEHITQPTVPPGGKRPADADTETLRKMLLAMAEDVRVVIIKIADRLHNMRTIQFLSGERQQAIARETMDIYAPLAGRLGIWQMKWQLEDLAFRVLEPDDYARAARTVRSRRGERERFVRRIERQLRDTLAEAGIDAEVVGRVKHLYSIHHKMRRYTEDGKSFDQIYDLIALRVLVDDVPTCYRALGVVHQTWHPIPGSFDDYIASPKESLYQSLHTSVLGPGAHPFEVQIRTRQMHEVAEYGVAAHWRYKEDPGARDQQYEERMAWLRHLLEWQQESDGADEFLESVKLDVFQDQVFVLTPQGEVKILPQGSTPVDFAFRIHTDLGYHTVGARVNGRLVPLTTRLHNGDVVEVIRGRGSKGPSRDWLIPELGYLATGNARQKVRQWFRKQERSENVARGRELVERERNRLGLRETPPALHARLGFESAEALHEAVGYGGVSLQSVAQRMADHAAALEREQSPLPVVEEGPRTPQAPPARPTPGVRVFGEAGMLTTVGRCCGPVPGDPIVGFVTRARGVTVHRADCRNIRNAEHPERLVECDWGPSGEMYSAYITVHAWDRVGLLRDISTDIAAEDVNMVQVRTQEHGDRTTTVHITLETVGRMQVAKVMSRLERLRGVISVARGEA